MPREGLQGEGVPSFVEKREHTEFGAGREEGGDDSGLEHPNAVAVGAVLQLPR